MITPPIAKEKMFPIIPAPEEAKDFTVPFREFRLLCVSRIPSPLTRTRREAASIDISLLPQTILLCEILRVLRR